MKRGVPSNRNRGINSSKAPIIIKDCKDGEALSYKRSGTEQYRKAGERCMSKRVALVTGSSRGIGRAIAIRLAKEGYVIAVNYRKREEEAKKTVNAIKDLGGEALSFRADVSKEDDVEKMFDDIESSLGKVSILVNNAGWGLLTPVTQMDSNLWDRHINVNLRSVFLCTKRALPSMIEREWGRIVNITSIAGIMGLAGLAAYSAAKAGIIGFTKSLAQELKGTGITVNAVAAGFVKTKMGLSFFEATGISPETWAKKWTLTERLLEPEDIAEVVAFLVSEKASNITGQVIVVDAGTTVAGGRNFY